MGNPENKPKQPKTEWMLIQYVRMGLPAGTGTTIRTSANKNEKFDHHDDGGYFCCFRYCY
jgi:hypothetical protein